LNSFGNNDSFSLKPNILDVVFTPENSLLLLNRDVFEKRDSLLNNDLPLNREFLVNKEV